MTGSGIGAQYPMNPIPTNTPAGCSGNRQSRSIGEDGDNAGDGTPRVPLHMNNLALHFVIPIRVKCLTARVSTLCCNHWGRPAPKGQGQKDDERVFSGAVVVKMPYQEIWRSEGP